MSDTGKQYAYNGVLLHCDKGVLPTPLTVLPRPSRIRGQFQAHELDKLPLVNIKPFGACALLRAPCMPLNPQWTQVHQGALRLGPMHARPLLESSICQCQVGGRISITMLPAAGTSIAPTPAAPEESTGDATAHEVADSFKWAALGFAALGVGLAIAGCFFPPLELAAGASFEAALAASASTAFLAADVSMAAGIGIDLAVAEVHPTPANEAVVVGDVVGLALGYGIGKGLSALASKYGPVVASTFAQQLAKRAGTKASFAEFIETVEQFKGGACPELAREAHDLYMQGKWQELETLFDRNALNDRWPPNRGFITTGETTLKKDFVFDRYGGYIDRETGEFVDKGTFVAPKEVDFPNRALPAGTKSKQYYSYKVLKDIPGVKQGQAIPWFEQPGQGIQYELPGGIDNLIRKGYIERIYHPM
jgi:hypothetical protein